MSLRFSAKRPQPRCAAGTAGALRSTDTIDREKEGLHMNAESQVFSLLATRELQYGAAIGAVAVLVLLLLRRRPTLQTTALFLAGALLTILSAPLLEAAFTIVDQDIAHGGTDALSDTNAVLARTLIIGGAAAVIGVLCIARAWRDSPER
jgi:hypothetical protein